MQEPKDFTRREEFEAPDAGYEPDRMLMCEEEIEVASGDEKVSSANSEKNVNSEMEKDMGKVRQEDQYDDENDDIQEVTEDADIEEVIEARSKKKGKSKKQSANSIKPMLIFALIALLAGGAYIGYEMLSAPVSAPVYQPPVSKAKAFPQANASKQTAKPTPVNQTQEIGNDASSLVAEISAKSQTKNPTTQDVVSPEVKPQISSLLPQTSQTTKAAESINEDIKAIRNQLNDVIKSLGAIGEKNSAQQVADSEFSRTILKEMTAEIQELSAQNKALSDELASAKKKIDELQSAVKNKEKKSRSVQKEKEQEQDVQQPKVSASTTGWEILGFSGNRVIVADERGTHSVSVGQSLNGVKILSVDVESGAVKTSAGILKYGQ